MKHIVTLIKIYRNEIFGRSRFSFANCTKILISFNGSLKRGTTKVRERRKFHNGEGGFKVRGFNLKTENVFHFYSRPETIDFPKSFKFIISQRGVPVAQHFGPNVTVFSFHFTNIENGYSYPPPLLWAFPTPPGIL